MASSIQPHLIHGGISKEAVCESFKIFGKKKLPLKCAKENNSLFFSQRKDVILFNQKFLFGK